MLSPDGGRRIESQGGWPPGVGQAVLGRGWHPGWGLTPFSLAPFVTKINRRVDRQGQGLPAGLL